MRSSRRATLTREPGARESEDGMALLQLIGVERSFYGVEALSGVDLEVKADAITGLIGPNGAGKTTLFNCITGQCRPIAAASSSPAPISRACGPIRSRAEVWRVPFRLPAACRACR